jgi:Fe-S-cluster containining protein
MPLEVKVEDLIRLGLVDAAEITEATKNELQRIARRLQQSGFVRSFRASTELFLMEARPNGDCLYLDENRQCRVYEKRPNVCRQFPQSNGLRLGYCPYIKKK